MWKELEGLRIRLSGVKVDVQLVRAYIIDKT